MAYDGSYYPDNPDESEDCTVYEVHNPATDNQGLARLLEEFVYTKRARWVRITVEEI